MSRTPSAASRASSRERSRAVRSLIACIAVTLLQTTPLATSRETALFGGQSMTAPLRRVLVRAPAETDCARWREYGWRSEPDPARLSAEHEDFCAILAEHGAEV